MPQSSLYYTDLQLPTLNGDGTSYGTVLNTYIQGLETKLKNLSDRVNAAGVGSSSTLAQINRDIAQTNTNTSGILPDPYSGNYSTVSTWPAFNTELTALGISPPETASEIETFFSSGDATILFNYLDGKLDALDIIVSQAETDLSSALQDTCATKTILDARTAAQSSGARETVESNYVGIEVIYDQIPTGSGTSYNISRFQIPVGSRAAVQSLINSGVLTATGSSTAPYHTFWGYRVSDETLGNLYSVGTTITVFSPIFAGEDRGFSGSADVQIQYDGPTTVDSTSRLKVVAPIIGNRDNFFGVSLGSTDTLRYAKRTIRYPYPTLNCSNPSPPYFS